MILYLTILLALLLRARNRPLTLRQAPAPIVLRIACRALDDYSWRAYHRPRAGFYAASQPERCSPASEDYPRNMPLIPGIAVYRGIVRERSDRANGAGVMGRHRAGDTLEMRLARTRNAQPVKVTRARIALVSIGRWIDGTFDADWLHAVRATAANGALLVIPAGIFGAVLAVTWRILLAHQTFSA